jgi:REP element-mobilizing transposase RayT
LHTQHKFEYKRNKKEGEPFIEPFTYREQSMTRYNAQKHHRRSIRLQNYDYSQIGSYFITLCVQNKKHLFGEIRNGIMGLNTFGSIAYQEWLETSAIRENISLGTFIIMPNHIHGIIHIDSQQKTNKTIGKSKSPSQIIGAIIRGYKGATTKKLRRSSVVRANCNSPQPRINSPQPRINSPQPRINSPQP